MERWASLVGLSGCRPLTAFSFNIDYNPSNLLFGIRFSGNFSSITAKLICTWPPFPDRPPRPLTDW